MRYFDDIFTVNFIGKCDWLPANNFLFQLANLFLVLTYLINPTNVWGLLQLRFALMMCGICFGIWGGFVICALDCMVWNLAFALGNGLHMVYLFIKMRPIKFEREHEYLYKEVFKPLGVKKFQYKNLMENSEKREFQEGSYYAKSGVTESNHIGIILCGKFEVRLKDMVISHIDPLEFIDSPEWIGTSSSSSTTYQVSLVALQPSIVVVWSRQSLMSIFKQDSVVKNVFDSLVGKDICKKLFSVHQRLLLNEAESSKVSNLLHQAPLVTYSTANLIDVHKIDISNESRSSFYSCHEKSSLPNSFIPNGIKNIQKTSANNNIKLHEINDNGNIFSHADISKESEESSNEETDGTWSGNVFAFDLLSENERQSLLSKETNI